MSDEAVVDRLYKEFEALDELLSRQGEVSLVVVAAEQSRKYLLLAAASYFEHCVTEVVYRWVETSASHNPHILQFLLKTGVNRCYHKWFKWEERDGKAFDGMLGTPLKDFLKAFFREDVDAGKAFNKFLEIGGARNKLVHQNFASYVLESTIQDIYSQYTTARLFPSFLDAALKKYSESIEAVE